MKAGILRLVLLGAATSLVLAGCGHDTTPADGSSPSAGASTSPAGSGSGDGTTTPGTGSGTGSGQSTGSGSPSASPSASGSSGGSGGPGAGGSSSGSTGDGTGAGLEMPEEAPGTVDSLSELLEPVGSAPLLTAPLPRAAQAQGRLVGQYPTVLRPVRSSRIDSSAISPSADRLQVSLVASSGLEPEQVLVAYRTRLAARGLVELSTPATEAGSVAAAFERGRSTITITASGAGARTSYVVHATLHVGGE